MTVEEQLSWATELDTQTAKALGANTVELRALRAAIERLNAGQSHILRTIAPSQQLETPTPDLISLTSFIKADNFPSISAALDTSLVLLFHRLTCFDLPTRNLGALRNVDVQMANVRGEFADHIQPVPASEVEGQISALCEAWRNSYGELITEQQKLMAIAEFHSKLLFIHPFLDGNGRTSRAILMQQCLDLFGKADIDSYEQGGRLLRCFDGERSRAVRAARPNYSAHRGRIRIQSLRCMLSCYTC